MKLSLSILMFISLVFHSCTAEKKNAPQDLIPVEKLTAILVDIHLEEASLAQGSISDSAFQRNRLEAVRSVLTKHRVEKSQYEATMEYYTENPESLEELYGQVINELSRIQGEAQGEKGTN